MKKKDYKRLGDYIQIVDIRNKDLNISNLLGLSMSKQFRPSTSNIIGVDLSKYKIVYKNSFAFDTMSVIRVHKVPIALNTSDTPIIVSPAYVVFDIVRLDVLDPRYLMMCFSCAEFDRYADFKSDSSVRGGYGWAELCDTHIYIPPIEEQRKIVSDYEAVTRRIELNEQTIQKLEETAQTLYRKMFVDDIDVENLPEGWRMGTIGEFCKEVKSGGTPSRSNNVYWEHQDYPWLKTGEVHNNIIIKTEEFISKEGLNFSSAKIIPAGSIVMAMYGATAAQIGYLDIDTTTNQACCNMTCKSKEDASFLYFHLLYNQDDIKRLANGGAQENLSQELIVQQPVLIIDNDKSKIQFVSLLKHIITKTKENNVLAKVQSMLLANMNN